jgi:hypothetical protein
MDLMNLIPTTDAIEVVIKHPSTFEPLLNDDGTEMDYYSLCTTFQRV